MQCPCCNNSRFILFWIDKKIGKATSAYRCVCTEPGKNRRWEKDGYNICENINCQNKRKKTRLYVPPGWGKRERALLENCTFKPTVTEDREYEKHDCIELQNMQGEVC